MATRQEMVTGIDVTKKTLRMIHRIWRSCHVLQGIEPSTGKPMTKYPDMGDTVTKSRPMEPVELKTEALVSFYGLHKVHIGMQSFLPKVSPTLLQRGLDYHNVIRPAFDSDIIQIGTSKGRIESGLVSTLNTDGDGLKALGETELPTFSLDMHIDSLAYPKHDYDLNVINEVFDCMSYELQQRHGGSGKPSEMSFEETRDLALGGRCVVIERRLPGVGGLDSVLFGNIWEYLVKNLPDCTTFADLGVLGKYIDNNIEKLTVVRRHWAL